MVVLVTGASGYIGGILINRLVNENAVDRVIALDMSHPDEKLVDVKHPKLKWIISDLAEDKWQAEIDHVPSVIVHSAFQIRQCYGKKRTQQIRSNLEGAKRLFRFAIRNKTAKIIHLSTVASYGALPSNTLSDPFKEIHPLREKEYSYAADKRKIENYLLQLFNNGKGNISFRPKISILRLATVTGPRGQSINKKINLINALKTWLPIIPIADENWGRQYVHEDDVEEIITRLITSDQRDSIEIYNVAAPGYLKGRQIAELLQKETIRISPLLLRPIFAILWHVSRARIPTAPNSWRYLCYPIVVDGTKVTRVTGYQYRFGQRETFQATVGKNFTPNST